MGISWNTALKTQHDDFADMLANQDLQNQRLLQITQAGENMRHTRASEDIQREQIAEQAKARAEATAQRVSAQKAMDEERLSVAAKNKAAIDEKAQHAKRLQAIIDDPNADPVMKKAAIWEQNDLKYKPSDLASGDAQQPVMRINPRTGKVEQIGNAPKGAHFVNEPAPPVAPNLHFQLGFGPDGSLVQQGFDPKTGKLVNANVGAAPPTVDQRNRKTALDVAKPIFKHMDDLVNSINTHHGMWANATGWAEKQAAKVNMDDDVAEYNGLLETYAPVILRAHGLLRPQVDQIETFKHKAAVQPTDSAEVALRKMRNLKQIGAEMAAAYGGAPSSTPAAVTTSEKRVIRIDPQGNEVRQ